ncbi:MAG: arsenate reductase (azurin) small subunit [Dehalococcoidia bacterium]
MAEANVWQPLARRRVSRRAMLKGAGKASVGAAGVALVGCGGDDDEAVTALEERLAGLRTELEQAQARTTELEEEVEARGAELDEAAAGAQAAPAAAAPISFPQRRIAGVGDLVEGEPIRFEYPLKGQSNILVKLGRPAAGGVGPDGDIVAFSEFCTHMGCPVGSLFKAEHGILGPCACHFTTFDLTLRGMVVIGQATENLPQVVLEIDGDDIMAVGVLGIIYGFRDNLADAPAAEGV